MTPSETAIRTAREDDRTAVLDVQERAFGDHGTVVAALTDALWSSDAHLPELSFVAERDGRVVGHVLFTRNYLDAPRRLVHVAVLSPLGVLPELQGNGIGSALVEHGLAALRESAYPAVFLEGSPRYYPRFGFTAGGAEGFGRPSTRIPEPAFQVVKLPAYEEWMTGALVYTEAFWRHDCVGLRDPEA